MAAPMTHAVISWALLRAYLNKRGLQLYSLEGIITGFCAAFFGVLFDFLDHVLFAPKDFKEDLKSRLKKVLKFQGAPPTKGVELPIRWFHNWPGSLLVLFSGFILFLLFPDSTLFSLPFVFWFVHLAVDRFQRNDENAPFEYSFWYPFKGRYYKKWGYPIKSRIEIRTSNVACILILFFEIIYFFTFIF